MVFWAGPIIFSETPGSVEVRSDFGKRFQTPPLSEIRRQISAGEWMQARLTIPSFISIPIRRTPTRVHTLDKRGPIGAGDNPVQLTLDNFSATGTPAAPALQITRPGVIYWPVSAQGYGLETAGSLSGPWSPLAADPPGGSFSFMQTATVAPSRGQAFFGLRK